MSKPVLGEAGVVIERLGQVVHARRYNDTHSSRYVVVGVCKHGLYLARQGTNGSEIRYQDAWLAYFCDFGRNVEVRL